MKHDQKFALVDFHDRQLLTLFDGETIFVAMKAMVEALGIDWPSQLQKLKSDPVLSKGMGLSPIPSERGAQDTIVLPIDLMHGWLFKLNPDRVKADARERVIAFQKECYQVLHDYWMKGAAVNPRFGNPNTGSSAEIIRLIDAVKRETNPAARLTIHQLLAKKCEAQDVQTPALEDMGQASQSMLAQMQHLQSQFWNTVSQCAPENFSRNADELAINIPQMREAMKTAGIRTPAIGQSLYAAMRADPRFIAHKPVNPKFGKVRSCWVFSDQ